MTAKPSAVVVALMDATRVCEDESAAETRQLCKTICLCFYYPLLRSRWRLCRLTDAVHPLRVPLC